MWRREKIYHTIILEQNSHHFADSISWWCHQMETFSGLLAICAGNYSLPGEFPAQRPVTWSFDVFFDLRLNKRLSKQSWGWWFEMLPHPLWHHSNVLMRFPVRKCFMFIHISLKFVSKGPTDKKKSVLECLWAKTRRNHCLNQIMTQSIRTNYFCFGL